MADWSLRLFTNQVSFQIFKYYIPREESNFNFSFRAKEQLKNSYGDRLHIIPNILQLLKILHCLIAFFSIEIWLSYWSKNTFFFLKEKCKMFFPKPGEPSLYWADLCYFYFSVAIGFRCPWHKLIQYQYPTPLHRIKLKECYYDFLKLTWWLAFLLSENWF